MTSFRKRTIWILLLSLLVITGMALYAYFIGTRTLLEHAENFSFSRMTAAQLPEQGSFRFFYATNRVPGDTQGPLDDRFGQERESSLKFGFFDTRVRTRASARHDRERQRKRRRETGWKGARASE